MKDLTREQLEAFYADSLEINATLRGENELLKKHVNDYAQTNEALKAELSNLVNKSASKSVQIETLAKEVDEANDRAASVVDQRDLLLAALEKSYEYIGNQKVPTCTHSNGVTHLLGTIDIKAYQGISETINAAIATAKGGAE